MNIDIDKLAPCPFCGGAARHLPANIGFYSERAICDACSFWLPPAAWDRRAATQPAPIPAQEITLQQVADRINGRGVMSPVEFRKFLNGDGVEIYPHQLVALVNLFATPCAGNALTDEAKDAEAYRWLLANCVCVMPEDSYGPARPALTLYVAERINGNGVEQIRAAIASHIKAGQAGKDGA